MRARRQRLFSLLALATLLWPLAPPAYGQGQGRPQRPYRGLFGGGVAEAEKTLTVNGSVGGGYDDNLLAEAGGAGVGGGGGVDPRLSPGGTLASFSGSLDYLVNREGFGMSASAGTSSRYYPDRSAGFVAAHGAGLGANWQVARRTNVTAGGSATYQPFTFGSLFPVPFTQSPSLLSDLDLASDLGTNPLEPANLDQTGSPRDYFSYSSQVGLGHRLTNRTSMSLGYGVGATTSSAYAGQFRQQNANAGILFTVTRDLGLRLGYGLGIGTYEDGSKTEYHNIDVGFDYQKALSFSRRTTMNFSTGMSAATSAGGPREYRAIGSASLHHEIGRTWTASASYNRGLSFVEILHETLFSDSVSVNLGGLVNRRLEVTSGASALLGDFYSGGYDTYYASLNVQFALTRHASVGAYYSYFWYDFAESVVLPVGLYRTVERQSVIAQVHLWAPIFQQRARRTNATR